MSVHLHPLLCLQTLIMALPGQEPLASSLCVPNKFSDLEHAIIDVATGYFIEKVRLPRSGAPAQKAASSAALGTPGLLSMAGRKPMDFDKRVYCRAVVEQHGSLIRTCFRTSSLTISSSASFLYFPFDKLAAGA